MVVQPPQPQPPPQPVYTGPTVSTNSGQPGNQQVQLKAYKTLKYALIIYRDLKG